jgi:hypothetical protein
MPRTTDPRAEERAAAILARIDDAEMDRLVDALARVLISAARNDRARDDGPDDRPMTNGARPG